MSQAIIDETTLSNLGDVTRTLMSDDKVRTPDEMVADLSGIMVEGTSKHRGDVTWSFKVTLRDLAVNRFALIDVNAQTDMNNMFYYCCSLSALSFPEGFGTKATTLSTCFKQCCSLTSLSFPEGFGTKATNMFGMFEACSSLTTLDFPEGFGANATKASQMFHGCSSLSALSLPDGFGAKATNIRFMFAKCSSLLSIHLPDDFFDYPEGNTLTATTSIFNHCTSLRAVNIPAGLSAMNNSASMFYGCSSLTSLDFPAGFGSQIFATNGASYMFGGCTSLSSITGDMAMYVSFSVSDCPLTHDSLINILNSIQTVTSKPTLTLGTKNLAKLTDDEKKIATDKGWTLA